MGASLLAPDWNALIGPYTRIATGIGELPVILWLVLMGARTKRVEGGLKGAH